MRIGINTRFLLSGKMEGFGWYTHEVVQRLVLENPEHEFYFFFDRKFDEKFIFGPNVTPIVLSPPARHPFLFVLWFEWLIKRALKKYKIDVFFSPDGYLSLGSKVPQIATIHDINFEHHPEDLPFLARKYLRFFFPRFAKKADHLLTVSEYTKNDLLHTYGLNNAKITVVWNSASTMFLPIEDSEKTEIKNRYTSGEDYFLFVGALHPRKNVKRLIEAFLLFKHKTGANIKLVIVGEALWKRKGYAIELPHSLKNEFVFTGHVSANELAKIIGAAYSLTYIPYFEGFGIPLVEAMKCGVPIISGNLSSLPEIAGEAALYCNPHDTQEIADRMEQLIFDRTLHAELSRKSIERSQLFSWDTSAKKIWDVIERTSYKPKAK
jgi:glycosyltransferase involved in cell wall biosynthesis